MLIAWEGYKSIKLSTQMVSAQELNLSNDARTYLSSEDVLSASSVVFHLHLLHLLG